MINEIASLSKREREIVDLASMGFLDKEIFRRLNISENTLKTYWKRIRSKLGDASKPGLIASYLKLKATTEASPVPTLEPDWIYDYRNQIWRHVSDRPIPGNIQVKEPLSLDEVLSYFHPEDAEQLRALIASLKENDVDDFFFKARLVTARGLVQTSTFVHVIRDATGKPITLLGHRAVFHDLVASPIRELMVGYWEQDLTSDEITADVNLRFIFGMSDEGLQVEKARYSKLPAKHLSELQQLVSEALEQKKTRIRRSYRLEAPQSPFKWVTTDVRIEYDAAGGGKAAKGSVLGFN
jgi:DNA-binding CsgD family transcriptional regulator